MIGRLNRRRLRRMRKKVLPWDDRTLVINAPGVRWEGCA
jgi:hypothetical protein